MDRVCEKTELFRLASPDGKIGFSSFSISMLRQAFREIMPLWLLYASPFSSKRLVDCKSVATNLS